MPCSLQHITHCKLNCENVQNSIINYGWVVKDRLTFLNSASDFLQHFLLFDEVCVCELPDSFDLQNFL